MNNIREYIVINGSKTFFNSYIQETEIDRVSNFLELVKLSDASKQNGQPFRNKTSLLIVKNDDYHGIVDTALDRLGPLIEELTMDGAKIYVHNPPRVLLEFLNSLYEQNKICLKIHSQERKIVKESSKFLENMNCIGRHIIGQENAIVEVTKSLWYLTNVERKKPYVIMLYGGSSLGKTELVRKIAKYFFDNKFFEKHLSMFKNDNYADYFFGEHPNRKSLGYDLLERESNLIFFDEIDKCPEYFYSAFYTLFDNTIFKDTNYDVDISGIVIILTSNFLTKEDMQKYLGLPIYYRIDKFIHFEDFSIQTIHSIVEKEIQSRESEFKDLLSADVVYNEVIQKVGTKGENARTIQYKVQSVIEELMFRKMKQ